ncbi:hypothetical protein Golob_009696 [Gossypium lobatum]|uniref:Myb/SANT-like domain-containing protein n=1 Tax=Gossypium lobatum TaxID=34289 RepID=A0A7J8MJG4_9ROSI|nr:hypothetical protein [Gossypium lobatum]
MQSLCSLMSAIGALIGFSISGVFVHLIGPKGVFGLLTIPAALVFSVGIVLLEPHDANFAYKEVSKKFLDAGKAMWRTLKCPEVWRPCLYMYLSFALSLNINEGLFYWYTDSKEGPLFSQFGIPDSVFVVIGEAVTQMIGRLKWMPLLVLTAKLCPSGIEGTFFALLMSIDNFGLLSSSWGGGLLLHTLNVTRTKFGNLWLAILIRNIFRLSPLGVLFLIPRGDPNSSILPTEMLGSEDETVAEESNNIELVSLVNSVDGNGDLTLFRIRVNLSPPPLSPFWFFRRQTSLFSSLGLRQFNDVKNLLGQNGFSWDESRQMVVADDYVWNAYIKAYPDARSYKTKAVLNFNDLCLIYGYTTADGRYSRSSHDLDFDDEVQGLNMGDAMGCLPSTNNERPRTEWNAEMDQYFIELMLDQAGKGNKVDNTFNKQAWTDMLALFNAKFGPQHGKRVLRHRYKKLWKYYSDVKVILNQNGFTWDESQLVITADNAVWDAYIKAHPHARTYRMKTLPNFNDLGLIYGEAIDEGSLNNLTQECDISRATAADRKGSMNCDRTRTFWTPPMDRYLIDLLLDQVHRGNKLGQTFLTQAWVDMVTSFNVKFGSHYDKDVLKNRYKHLRRLYNDIKILLEQSGFSWDETRDMVIAEDSVWNAYIKSHPDARSYRVKTVPSYHKLRVIFGQENCEVRYNRLTQKVGTDDDSTVLMTSNGNEKNDHLPDGIHHLELEWTTPMEQFFMGLLLEQVREQNKMAQAFNEQAWVHMVESFNEKFRLQLDKNILENHYICLLKQYNDICDLLNHNGFLWDNDKKMVVANNDVWEVYVKEHPDAVSYRDKVLGSYGDLCKIFRDEVLEGIPCGQVLGVGTDCFASEVVLDRACGNLQTPTGDINLSDQQMKRSIATPQLERASKAQKTEQEMQKMLSKMAGAVTRLASKNGNKNYSTIESAVDALQALPDMDDELLLDACDLLEDERKAKTFLALDITLRKKWLLRKLRS